MENQRKTNQKKRKNSFDFFRGGCSEAVLNNSLFKGALYLFFLFLFSGNLISDHPSSQTANPKGEANPKIQIPDKSRVWNKSVAQLVSQIVTGIPQGDSPKIGVFKFKDKRQNQITDFSARIREDLLIHLMQVENLSLTTTKGSQDFSNFHQISQEKGLDYYVEGFYLLNDRGLEIWPQVRETRTNTIVHSGYVRISHAAISAEDLALLGDLPPKIPSSESAFNPGKYNEALEKLLSLTPEGTSSKVKLWAEKNKYHTGDTINFYVQAEKAGYLILIDISPNGDAKIIFPNSDSPNNFLRKNETVQIPDVSSGVEFKVQGPIGLERFKAIVSSTPGLPVQLNLDQRFYGFENGRESGARDIQALINAFAQKTGEEWAEAYMEILILEKPPVQVRGGRKVPLIDKPKDPIDMIGTMGKEEKP